MHLGIPIPRLQGMTVGLYLKYKLMLKYTSTLPTRYKRLLTGTLVHFYVDLTILAVSLRFKRITLVGNNIKID